MTQSDMTCRRSLTYFNVTPRFGKVKAFRVFRAAVT
jgi:hypothetical protein